MKIWICNRKARLEWTRIWEIIWRLLGILVLEEVKKFEYKKILERVWNR